ncbi:MAG: signal peptidase I [Pelagibacterales bacterium]|nr:signal peptidase I [Pelagibacterales bacterium]
MNFIEWLYFFLIINLIIGLGSWKLFKISGKNPYTSIIPFYNILNTLDIIKRPRWWIFLVFLPTINLLMIPVIWIEFIKRFNHSTKRDISLMILSLGFYTFYINYFSNKKAYIDSEISTSGFEKSIGSFVFAIVVATIVHNYFIQPFVIPTGSLEKTLKVGDFLFVSKFHYGARVPQTVISLPLVHDTIPLIKSRSYIKKPQLPYLRLIGFQKIRQNDIVVFNWPADTVRKFFVKEKGVIKPIDKKSNYVKRAVGLPGDVFEIKDGLIYINGKENILPYRANPLLNYKVYSNRGISSSKLINIGIKNFIRKYEIDISNQSSNSLNKLLPYLLSYSQTDSNKLIVITNNKGIPIELVRSLNLNIIELLEKEKDLKLTFDELKRLEVEGGYDSINRLVQNVKSYNTIHFPNNIRYNWNNDNFGPIKIPKKGQSVSINIDNLPIYKRIIKEYENNDLEIINNNIYINQQESTSYTFKMDYYWMMGDNRYNSEDSRVWGFVPYDHVLGKPVFIWMSIDGLFEGIGNWKIRWDRVFTTVGLDGEPRSYFPHFIAFIVFWQLYLLIVRRRNKSTNDPLT